MRVDFGGDSDGKEVRVTRAKVFGDCVYARELYLDAFNELINSAFEYPNAETLVLRYPGVQDGLPDALARLVRDDDYLYVAVKGARPAKGPLLNRHSYLALHIDAN